MNNEKVNEIMEKIESNWKERIPKESTLNQEHLNNIRILLKQSPHEDGKMPVALMDNPEEVYLIPIEDIILKGIKGKDILKYLKRE